MGQIARGIILKRVNRDVGRIRGGIINNRFTVAIRPGRR